MNGRIILAEVPSDRSHVFSSATRRYGVVVTTMLPTWRLVMNAA